MIKRIELWNFESHEHTVVDDLSPGLNLICGDSNAGKTSIVRALKLVAYNEFDPRSVRTGKTKCKVLVETERGTVVVTRGSKDNLWEVTPVGKPTEYFSKVGTQIVPAAAKILGLNIVKLGDVDVPVNIMDQLESHFMLAGVGNKDVTGSMRAQIVDEISGLSGIEGLIKAVSLDNHRFGREIKELEDQMENVRKQLHDETALQQEAKLLAEVEQLLTDSAQCEAVGEACRALLDDWNKTVENYDALTAELDTIPDTDEAKQIIDAALTIFAKADKARLLMEEIQTTQEYCKTLEAEIQRLPDGDNAIEILDEVDKVVRRVESARILLNEYNAVQEQYTTLNSRLGELDGIEDAMASLETAEMAFGKTENIRAFCDEIRDVTGELETKQKALEACERELEDTIKARDALLATIKVCPLTLKPIRPECLEGTRS